MSLCTIPLDSTAVRLAPGLARATEGTASSLTPTFEEERDAFNMCIHTIMLVHPMISSLSQSPLIIATYT